MKKIYKLMTVIVTIVFSTNIIAFAESTSALKDKIEQNQSEIDSLADEKDKVNNEINSQTNELQDVLNKIEEKSKELNAAKEEVQSYEVKINEVQYEIDRINNEIINSQNEIESREKLIVEKQEEAVKIKSNIDKRLIGYYKIDVVTNYIYLILKSEDILSLFNNIQNIYRLINFDKTLITEAKRIEAELENEKNEIAKQLESIEENKKGVIAKQNELKEAQKEYIAKQEYHESKMNELQAMESEKSGLLASLSDKEKELEEQIGDLVSYNQELQAELDNIFASINSSNNSGGGTAAPETPQNPENPESPEIDNSQSVGDPSTESFLRPGSGPITDPYGPRINPVTGEPGFHTGTDFGDPYGAPVAASKSGVVVYSGWINGYGNTVILDHGNGIQTLYGHNSENLVSVGQSVYRGQTIALVGSTGMSTGPHIHWEIRINGQHVNPMDYL